MPAHPKAMKRLHWLLTQATTRPGQDQVLDEILDTQQRATEWDADQWGFDPDRWMASERTVLAARGGTDYPAELERNSF